MKTNAECKYCDPIKMHFRSCYCSCLSVCHSRRESASALLVVIPSAGTSKAKKSSSNPIDSPYYPRSGFNGHSSHQSHESIVSEHLLKRTSVPRLLRQTMQQQALHRLRPLLQLTQRHTLTLTVRRLHITRTNHNRLLRERGKACRLRAERDSRLRPA